MTYAQWERPVNDNYHRSDKSPGECGKESRAKSPRFSIDWQPGFTSTSTTAMKMGKHPKHESGSSFVLSLGPGTQPLVLTPFPNPSRSSYGSEGSSYHSMDEEDGKKNRVEALFAKIEG